MEHDDNDLQERQLMALERIAFSLEVLAHQAESKASLGNAGVLQDIEHRLRNRP